MKTNNIVCFRHPEYKGKGTPVLQCKNCCNIYVAAIVVKSREQLEADKNMTMSI